MRRIAHAKINTAIIMSLYTNSWNYLQNIASTYYDIALPNVIINNQAEYFAHILIASKLNPELINYSQYIDDNLRKKAIMQNYTIIEFTHKTDELIKFAIHVNPHAIKYVRNASDIHKKLAIKSDISTIKYFQDEYELCIYAIKTDVRTLNYINNQTLEYILLALSIDIFAIKYVRKLTREICLICAKTNGLTLEFMQEFKNDSEIATAAINQNILALKFARNIDFVYPSKFSCLEEYKSYLIVKNNGLSIKNLKYQTHIVRKTAIQQNPMAVQTLRNKLTQELRLLAVNIDGLVLRNIPINMRTKEVCLAAIKQNKASMYYIYNVDILHDILNIYPEYIKYINRRKLSMSDYDLLLQCVMQRSVLQLI